MTAPPIRFACTPLLMEMQQAGSIVGLGRLDRLQRQALYCFSAAHKPSPTTLNYVEALRSEREAAKRNVRLEPEPETTGAATRQVDDEKPETKKPKTQTTSQSRTRPARRQQQQQRAATVLRRLSADVLMFASVGWARTAASRPCMPSLNSTSSRDGAAGFGSIKSANRTPPAAVRPPQLVASTAEKTRPARNPKRAVLSSMYILPTGRVAVSSIGDSGTLKKAPLGGAEKQGAEMQGHVYPPPPNLPRRVSELGNALSSVVFVNYQTSRRRDDQDHCARAQECELRARQVNDREVRRQFQSLRDRWRQMAAQWAELSAERERVASVANPAMPKAITIWEKVMATLVGFGTFAALPEEQISETPTRPRNGTRWPN
jgi:hypothetical protein